MFRITFDSINTNITPSPPLSHPGTPPACANFCSEALGACVDCLSNNDCGDGVACTVDFCTPATGLCTSSPDDLECNNGSFCAPETCDVVAGCQPASNPCTGATPFCDEALDQCNECVIDR